jgi:hypothetical protein
MTSGEFLKSLVDSMEASGKRGPGARADLANELQMMLTALQAPDRDWRIVAAVASKTA